MVTGRVLFALVVANLVLPVAIVIVFGAARLLGGMQDVEGSRVLDRVSLAGGVIWAILLVCLVLAQGINSLRPTGEDEKEPHE